MLCQPMESPGAQVRKQLRHKSHDHMQLIATWCIYMRMIYTCPWAHECVTQPQCPVEMHSMTKQLSLQHHCSEGDSKFCPSDKTVWCTMMAAQDDGTMECK